MHQLLMLVQAEDSSTEDLQGDPARQQGDGDGIYASLALWDLPSASNSPKETS